MIENLTVCGKVIGSASGWDQVDDFQMHFYDAKLNDIGRKLLPDFEEIQKTRKIGLQFSTEHGFLAVDEAAGTNVPIKVDWTALNN